MTDKEHSKHLNGCLKGNRQSQKVMYHRYYNLAMSTVYRYTNQIETAKEVVNDGFVKVFKNIHQYSDHIPFDVWLKRVMINTAIDAYRKAKQFKVDLVPMNKSDQNAGLSNLNYNDLMKIISQVSPQYRTVFMLYVVDGYSHKEIAERLGITIGTSKSNLKRARENIKILIKETSSMNIAQ